MKQYIFPIIGAVIFGFTAWLITVKLRAYVDVALIVAAILAGFFVVKNNIRVTEKFKV